MQNLIPKIGFWSGIAAFISAVAYVIVQVMQILGFLTYPNDEILIYGSSLCIVIPFLIEMLAFHYLVPIEARFWTHGALNFSLMYAVFVTANYVVQLATVIPMTLRGNAQSIAILQQTPHSLFWDFDALGYICMGLATFIAVPALQKSGVQKWTRAFFISNGIVNPLIAVVYFYPEFSPKLLILGFPWAITAPGSMLLLAVTMRREFGQTDSDRTTR